MAANVVEVRPSDIKDVFLLAANLRDADALEVRSLGVDPKRGIRDNFKSAMLRKTYLVNGEVAAMSGLCGSMLGDIGYPYLMTTKLVERVPVSFVRLAREGIYEMLHHKLRLEGHVAADYRGACRLLEVLGFRLGKPETIGEGQFRKFFMVA